jgi:hypothetical protein
MCPQYYNNKKITITISMAHKRDGEKYDEDLKPNWPPTRLCMKG